MTMCPSERFNVLAFLTAIEESDRCKPKFFVGVMEKWFNEEELLSLPPAS